MAAGVTVPSVVLNVTSRRPDGRLDATVAVTRIVDMPSAGADPLVWTVTTSDGFADVKFTVNSNGRSYAVTRTRAGPAAQWPVGSSQSCTAPHSARRALLLRQRWPRCER